jgi:hypothetical protein
MAAPKMYSDEELFLQTGSWDEAAKLRDAQNNALNQYNWSQQAATTPVSLPNYENAYDAFGGKEATDSLLAQLRALGLSEDTINSALTPYFKTAAVTSPAITSSAATPPSNIPTFSEQITAGPGTTQNEFMSLVSEPASTVVGGTGNDTVTGAKGNDTVVGGTGNDTVVGAAADNITRSGLTGQAGQMVVEGDDIETQISQLPTEYASWSRSADQRTMELIRKSDGAVLDRRTVGDFSDLDLAKIGLSFIPGAGQILAGLNVADAVRRGDLLQAAIGVTGLMPGAQNVNTALRVGQAAGSGNTFGALTALAGNTDLQNLTGLNTANVGGFTAKDVMAAGSLTQAALAGNTAGVLTSLGTLTNSSDTVLAGKALSLFNRIQNGDTRALGEAMALSNGVSSGGSTAAITSLSEEDLAELKPGELEAYQKGGVQGLVDFRRSQKTSTGASSIVGGAGNDVTLPTGVQLASAGDGVFRTDVGGTPIFAESKNAGTVTPPFGYALLSSTEADNKPDGAYYDITANAWFKPSTDLTDLTGGTTLKADTDLFNSSLGDLDRLDNTNRTTDDFADFLKTIGITNVSQLTDSGLSNQDILDMINALDDTVSVTGAKGNDSITGVTGLDSIKGGTGNDNIETVSITGAKGNDTVTGIDTIKGGDGNDLVVDDKGTVTIVDKKESCPIGSVLNPQTGECEIVDDKGTVTIVDKKESCPIGTVLNPETGECEAITETLTCPPGKVLNEAGTACIDEVIIKDKKESCPIGTVLNPETGECEAVTEQPITCPAGYELNDAGTECIPVVTITDKKCDTGFVYDEDLKMCVPITVDETCPTGFHKDESGKCVPDTKEDLKCPEGYEPNEAGTECIPVVTIVDKKCPPGQVYDEDLKMCVPVKPEECPEGYHRDPVTGACVPDEVKCEKGYHLEGGVCVKDKLECPKGYELNDAGTECIPIIEIVDKKCPPGQVYDEDLKQCVPIKEEECPTGYHRDEATGTCVPDEVKCEKGYHLENGVCVKDTLVCEKGFELNEAGTECIPVVEIKACPTGQHRDETGKCVPDTLICPKGYELNDAGTECIPVVEIVDKKCAAGFVYDEELKKCVPIEEDKCPTGYHRDESGTCVQDECPEGYVRNLVTGVCEKPLVCEEGFELNDEGTECIPVIKVTACPIGQHRDETGKCVPDTEECAEGFHLKDGICVPDDDEKCQDGYEKVNGACVPVCQEGYIRNLETGTCEKPEDKSCPIGQVRNAEGKCVPVTTITQPIVCPAGFKLVNGACVPITTTTPTYTTGASGAQGEKIDPIYAGGMDDFNLLATLEELLSNEAPKKDTKKSKDKTKMATGGHLDDLLAEQMTVDDLLKLLR